ncbi:hypothetical protein ACFV3R_00830 [Streptomyces sp. NPDC059740]|uniref:hypothetical protein n=1 Tax=Streptomyces sp. NPDC059740 TaxID=3346926 RepID=UPI003663C6D3
MGWTHDYSDVARDRRSSAVAVAVGSQERNAPRLPGGDTSDLTATLGIPHILRRRARWMTARLRHTRT